MRERPRVWDGGDEGEDEGGELDFSPNGKVFLRSVMGHFI